MTKSKMKIEDYNPEWSIVFKDLKYVIEAELDDLLLSIEHVGSTSVNNLSAKPIIDLDLIIDNHNMLPQVIQRLEKLGYYHEGDLGIKGREVFGRKDRLTPWHGDKRVWIEHHLYVCCKDNKELAKHLAFRNYLRIHPEAVREYGQLKKKLAETAKNRVSYTEGKNDFVNKVLEKVMKSF
ncbi:GrpB family protein (plasmid) [Bacillus mycoides]|uniref:GrpB family protein n=1 Tax=Bacillus mycoides TaxID=1405 RepID=UPI001C01BC4A|nr:GrpB family protein [Bacillus mycoides]QWH31761.1 GrpB family protein [Bacillus mycoides]